MDIKKNSIELIVPDYYLQMQSDTIQQYCKLAKVSQEDKHKKAVAAFIKSGHTKVRKTSMSINSKEFIPKEGDSKLKKKSGSFDATKTSIASSLKASHCDDGQFLLRKLAKALA